MMQSPSLQTGPTPAFAFQPLPPAYVARVRSTGRDDFGRRVEITRAEGGEPLRDLLRRALPGEPIILCSYQAVPLPSPFAEIGPVFISAGSPGAKASAGALPEGYFPRTLALRAYDAADRIVASAVVEPPAAPDCIREMLRPPGVAYLHARFAGHGCFAARVDRAG